jgi:hypothetical protein
MGAGGILDRSHPKNCASNRENQPIAKGAESNGESRLAQDHPEVSARKFPRCLRSIGLLDRPTKGRLFIAMVI